MAILSLQKNAAFTLLELLICLSILFILLSLALPNYSIIAEKNTTKQDAKKFLHALSLARSTAINTNSFVTFCKSDDAKNCKGSWQKQAIVFIDKNTNAKVDDEDRIIYQLNANSNSIRWRAFQNKQYIQMTPLGHTNNQNGNFTFCPTSNRPEYAEQLVVNRTGRVRIAIDSDGDGLKERSNGSPLQCP